MVYHLLRGGAPLCGFSSGPPSRWPAGHLWIPSEFLEARTHVCTACARAHDDPAAYGELRAVEPCLDPDRPVALLASGPSLTPRQVWEVSQAGWHLVGCNNQAIYALDILWAPDHSWLDAVEPRRLHHVPYRYTTLTEAQRRQKRPPPLRADWRYLLTDPNIALSLDDRQTLARGRHAGYQLINLAALAGGRRLVLLGYDGRKVPGQPRHWFGSHPPGPLDCDSNYELFNREYDKLPAALEAAGVEVLNATEGSAIGAFPRVELAALLG